MNETHLRQFYENKGMLAAVNEFFIENLKRMAVDTVFDKKATAGIYEAKKLLDLSFDKLDELYGKIPSAEIANSR